MKKLLIAGTLLMTLSLSPIGSAHATILFVGGEDSDFTSVGSGNQVSTGVYQSGYSRESIEPGNGGSPASNYYLSPTFSAQSVLWIHAFLYSYYNDNGSADMIRVFSPDGIARIVVKSTSTNHEYAIYSNNSSGTLTLLTSMTSPCNSAGGLFPELDLYINYATSGEVTLYCNSAAAADYVGNVTTNSATHLNQFFLACGVTGGCNNNIYQWSEIIASTSDTRNMRVVTLHPNANGNTHNWDVAAASNVNKTSINYTSVDASGTSGEIDEYTTQSTPMPTTANLTVLDVRVAGQFQVDSTGPQHVQAMVRTGGTDYSSSNLSPPQASWGYVYNDWTINPNTGVAWTTSDLNATGVNIGFSSQN